MAGVNKVILVGHLGKDPEIRAIESGKRVCSFTLATTESYKDKNGEKVENTEWHNIVFWGPVVDVFEKYVKKGTQIYIEGKLRTRSYESKEGVKKYITEVLGENMTLLGSPRNQDQTSSSGSYQNSSSPSQKSSPEPKFEKSSLDETDDLPF